MGIFDFITGIFKPAAKLIDDLHTSGEEKLQLKAELTRLENEMASKILEYETKLTEAQTSIIRAESTGHSWLQRNWRPIVMLVFLVLVVLDSFGVLENSLSEDAWFLLQIGLGGYVAGRSLEKIVPGVTRAMKTKGEDGAVG